MCSVLARQMRLCKSNIVTSQPRPDSRSLLAPVEISENETKQCGRQAAAEEKREASALLLVGGFEPYRVGVGPVITVFVP